MIMRALATAAVVAFLANPAYAGGELTFTARSVNIAELPPSVFERQPDGEVPDDWLETRPALVLDGGTLIIGRPGAAPDVTLHLSRLELRNGAKIITNGAIVEIDAHRISSQRGRIVSFESPDMDTTPAAPGITGRAGNAGGRVILNGKLVDNGVLKIDLFGQNGQAGGIGRAGPAGAPGSPGSNAADHLFDCAHGGGAGGPGQPGKDGEQGARGGRGGNGGILVLKGRLAAQVDQVDFAALEGAGGEGGAGGPGGPGGPGGQGGHGSTYCGGGPNGPAGPAGNFGPRGPNGESGTRGQLVVNVG
jgi:hypothetical protein